VSALCGPTSFCPVLVFLHLLRPSRETQYGVCFLVFALSVLFGNLNWRLVLNPV